MSPQGDQHIFDALPYPQLFVSFMENSPALWWMKDADGKYLFINPTYARYFDVQPERIVGQTDFDFMPRYVAEQLRANDLVVLESQKSLYIHETVEAPNGIRIILSTKFPFEEGGRKFVGGIGLDVTDPRKAQIELEYARDRALESEALKSTFISSIQHEIRTPLNGISGMIEILLMTDLNSEQREYAQVVQGSSEALVTVMNDILDLSKFESGRLQLASVPMSIQQIVKESVRLIGAAAQHKGLEIRAEMDKDFPQQVWGDPERLRQVLLNLLSNAVKFTREGSVDVRVSLLEQSTDTVFARFLIKDTGIGIEPDKQPYLYMPFWQADMSNTRLYGGPGLGLPVTKHIIEKMCGSIQCESSPGEGTSFWFDVAFPTKPETNSSGRLPESEIVLVEDNPTLQGLLMRQFENLGLAVKSVGSCIDAEEIVSRKPYRLVLCELIVQDSDALDLIQRIRAKEVQMGRQRTPIVVMAIEPKSDQRAFYIARGADDYIAKPVTIEQIWRIVSYWGLI